MRITRKLLSIDQSKNLVPKVVDDVITFRVQVVTGKEDLEDITVALETLYLVNYDGLSTIGTFLAIFIDLLWETLEMFTV